jgi:glycosyltransferase involved in cell wall biosynthesis
VWRLLRRLTYRGADYLVSVSKGVDAGFRWLPADRRQVIYNPIDVTVDRVGSAVLPDGLSEGRFVAAMGRLTHEKGFDLLVDAFAKVNKRCSDWALAILGDGPERAGLEDRIRNLGLSNSVFLLGLRKDPFPYLRAAGLFALSSRREGFGNVLAEAMACGLPGVSFDCPSGPTEIVTHGEDGVLVPPGSVEQLAQAMIVMIEDPERRHRMARQAQESARRFHLDRIVQEWEATVFARFSSPGP